MKTETLLSTSVTHRRVGCKSRPMPTRRGRGLGFTLIELMITVTIVGILAAAGMPAFSSFVAGQRIKTASFDVMSTLMLARSEALKRNANVTIAPVMVGNVVDRIVVTAADGTVLNSMSMPKGVVFTVSVNSITYQPSGRTTATATFGIRKTGSSVTERCISIDLSGRPNSKKGACS